MLEGLMQHDHPLTLQLVLERMRGMNGDAEVVTLTEDGATRTTYAEVGDRVDRLCRGLQELGVEEGDRVATFSWNSQYHLEAYLAAPCMGAVLHTLNIRLFPEQLVYVVNHAQDKVILVDALLVDALAEHVDQFETVEHYVVMGDERDLSKLPNAISYEELLARQEPGFDYPEIDDRAGAGLCYTSGTTGNPKGVLYSHRSNILHTMGQCMADGFGISPRRPRPPGGADVPRQRVGAALRGVHGGREPDHALALPAGRAAGEADRARAGDGGGRGADDLARRAALVRRAQARPLEHPHRGVRRRGRPARAHEGVRGAPRDADRPGLGHDRDEPARVGRAPAGGAARARSTGTTARPRAG